MKIQNIFLKASLLLFGGLWLLLVASLWSDVQASDEEYNFNWLDPDKKIYVLQNRRYVKAERPLVSFMPGVGMSSPYRSTYTVDGRIAYYFSEVLGVEAFYSHAFNSENNTYKALAQASAGVLPVVREIQGKAGIVLQWVPWYAKINVFNEILYFDWYFSAGAGQVMSRVDTRTNINNAPAYTKQNLVSAFLSTGHLYHLNEMITVRLDFGGAFYQAKLFGTSGESSWNTDYQFGIGMGLRL